MMVEEAVTGESRDGKGSGDRNSPFEFGHWRVCLTVVQQARLTVMRGYVRDVSHAPMSIRGQLRYGGDDFYAYLLPSGVYVSTDTAEYWSDEP